MNGSVTGAIVSNSQVAAPVVTTAAAVIAGVAVVDCATPTAVTAATAATTVSVPLIALSPSSGYTGLTQPRAIRSSRGCGGIRPGYVSGTKRTRSSARALEPPARAADEHEPLVAALDRRDQPAAGRELLRERRRHVAAGRPRRR